MNARCFLSNLVSWSNDLIRRISDHPDNFYTNLIFGKKKIEFFLKNRIVEYQLESPILFRRRYNTTIRLNKICFNEALIGVSLKMPSSIFGVPDLSGSILILEVRHGISNYSGIIKHLATFNNPKTSFLAGVRLGQREKAIV